MSDLLINSAASMNVYRRALEVTSNNIANVNTGGYTKTRVDITESPPSYRGQNAIGLGAIAVDIVRGYHNFVGQQLEQSTTSLNKLSTIDTFSTQLPQLFATDNNLLDMGMKTYYEGWNNLANDPTNINSQQALVRQHEILSDTVSVTATALGSLHQEINKKMTDIVDKVNALAVEITRTNIQLGLTTVDTAHSRNDLLDHRDQKMRELNQYVDAKLFHRSTGIVDLYTGEGQQVPLVTDNRLVGLRIDADPFGQGLLRSNESNLWIQQPGTSVMVDVTQHITGGELGGMIRFRAQALKRAEDEVGLAVAGLMIASNQWHRQGVDTNNQAGGDLFSMNGATSATNAYTSTERPVYRHEQNQGDALLNVNLYGAYPPSFLPSTYQTSPDLAALRARSYELEYDEKYIGGFRVRDSRTGEAIPAKGDGSSVSPLQFEGLEVVLSAGLPRTGDRFEVRFTKDALYASSTQLTDPTKIAYRPAGTGIGNNVIAANIASLQDKRYLFDQKESAQGMLDQAALSVGRFHEHNTTSLSAQQAMQKQLEDSKQAADGVNLDQEAENLMRYQQAFQASASVMQASRKLFSLLRSIM